MRACHLSKEASLTSIGFFLLVPKILRVGKPLTPYSSLMLLWSSQLMFRFRPDLTCRGGLDVVGFQSDNPRKKRSVLRVWERVGVIGHAICAERWEMIWCRSVLNRIRQELKEIEVLFLRCLLYILGHERRRKEVAYFWQCPHQGA